MACISKQSKQAEQSRAEQSRAEQSRAYHRIGRRDRFVEHRAADVERGERQRAAQALDERLAALVPQGAARQVEARECRRQAAQQVHRARADARAQLQAAQTRLGPETPHERSRAWLSTAWHAAHNGSFPLLCHAMPRVLRYATLCYGSVPSSDSG
jgi:hypothetical protein